MQHLPSDRIFGRRFQLHLAREFGETTHVLVTSSRQPARMGFGLFLGTISKRYSRRLVVTVFGNTTTPPLGFPEERVEAKMAKRGEAGRSGKNQNNQKLRWFLY